MMGSAGRWHMIGGSSRIAEESPGPFLFDEVVHLARPGINSDGLRCLFLRPVEHSGASHIGFSDAVGLDQFQLDEDMR
jgi:hypothetical protein